MVRKIWHTIVLIRVSDMLKFPLPTLIADIFGAAASVMHVPSYWQMNWFCRSQSNKIKYMVLILFLQLLSISPIFDIPCIHISSLFSHLDNQLSYWEHVMFIPLSSHDIPCLHLMQTANCILQSNLIWFFKAMPSIHICLVMQWKDKFGIIQEIPR